MEKYGEAFCRNLGGSESIINTLPLSFCKNTETYGESAVIINALPLTFLKSS